LVHRRELQVRRNAGLDVVVEGQGVAGALGGSCLENGNLLLQMEKHRLKLLLVRRSIIVHEDGRSPKSSRYQVSGNLKNELSLE